MGYFYSKGATATTYDAAVLADSPVGYWRLGESSGTTAADSSGNGRDGVYVNSPTLGETGAVSGGNTAALFARASSESVNLGNPAAFNFTGQVTMECWYKPTSFPSGGQEHTLVAHGFDSGNHGYCLRLSGTSGIVEAFSYDGALYGTTWTISGWSTGQWRHIVGGYDGANWKLFIDGTEVASTAAAEGAQTSTVTTNIGAISNNGSIQDFANGTIDEVAIYNTWIGGTRIAAHFAAA